MKNIIIPLQTNYFLKKFDFKHLILKILQTIKFYCIFLRIVKIKTFSVLIESTNILLNIFIFFSTRCRLIVINMKNLKVIIK